MIFRRLVEYEIEADSLEEAEDMWSSDGPETAETRRVEAVWFDDVRAGARSYDRKSAIPS